MEKMLNEFKEEYACQYSLYLDSSEAVDSLSKQEDYDEQEMAYIRVRWQRKRSVMRELRRVAKIFGYTQEDIERWEDAEYEKYYKIRNEVLTMTKSVYLEDFGKATNAPDFLIRAMRERKIIPRDIHNDAVMITIYGAGSWRVSWAKDNVIYTYNPWTALITES